MIQTFFQDIIDTVKYDVFAMQKPYLDRTIVSGIPKHLEIKVTSDNKGMTLLFPDLQGMVLFTDKFENALEVINDGLTTYFDIPRYYAKNMKFVNYLKDSKGKIVAQIPSGKEILLKAYK